MKNITTIGFDLVNTLVFAKTGALDASMNQLVSTLRQDGISFDDESFKNAYQKAIQQFVEKTRKDGKESHNRFWVAGALKAVGYDLSPDDKRIADAVEAYFSVICNNFSLIPGTMEMLHRLRIKYHLGLLSNFTHAPAARNIIERTGISSLFDVALISGDLGYRKPHPKTFNLLANQLGEDKANIVYIGDDPEPDIIGAKQAGLQPVWTTYVRDQGKSFTPVLVPGRFEKPNFEVPTISSWKDLFRILKDG
ncbi:HAD family hydrolase [Thermodesulfobacteriota bacterium]